MDDITSNSDNDSDACTYIYSVTKDTDDLNTDKVQENKYCAYDADADLETLLRLPVNMTISETTGYNRYECVSPVSLSNDLNETFDHETKKLSMKNSHLLVDDDQEETNPRYHAQWVEVNTSDVLSVSTVASQKCEKENRITTQCVNSQGLNSNLSRSMETIWRPVWKSEAESAEGLFVLHYILC